MPSDYENDADPRRESMIRSERIRTGARTLRTPRTVAWVAEETDTSVKTAQKYLDQLVADNVLRKIKHGDQTLYCIDHLMATYREIATLQREHDREDLTESLKSMRSEISDWQAEYDVTTPGELRGTIAELDDTEEITERRDIAREWEHFADRIPIVHAAINEYDLATGRDTLTT